MTQLHYTLIIVLISFHLPVHSQTRWDGGAVSNQWNNALNWSSNSVPTALDDVLLDNSFVSGSYSVVLPPMATHARTITIRPSAGQTIELTLPPTNRETPGLTVSGSGYGLNIHEGGVFRNSSGATVGNAISVRDSIRINNGGLYIHNTSGAHASSVQILSRASGTEEGIFEMDIPSASSTISLSERVFGRLRLRAAAAGGTCNYTAAGTSRAIIRTDFEIQTGVRLRLNYSDTIFVWRDFFLSADTFDLGTTTRSVVLHIRRNFQQSSGSVITESGTGVHEVVFAGTTRQTIAAPGPWLNNVALVKTGHAPLALTTPVSLPFRLSLRSGEIVTTPSSLLTLRSGCAIEADSLAINAVIFGPLRKEQMNNSSFLFPVGSATRMRWLKLEQATGSFTVEYVPSNPRSMSSLLGAGLHHISELEHWNIDASGSSSAAVKLSFIDPNSGGVTDLPSLRVARLVNGIWQNAGNTAVAGNPASDGWVRSDIAAAFSQNSRSFTLASSMQFENPLPVVDLALEAQVKKRSVELTWQMVNKEYEPVEFEVQSSDDGLRFRTFAFVPYDPGQNLYSFTCHPGMFAEYYRVRMKNRFSDIWYESVPVKLSRISSAAVSIYGSNIIGAQIQLYIQSPVDARLTMAVYDMQGGLILLAERRIEAGIRIESFDVQRLKAGMYFIRVLGPGRTNTAFRVLKR
jgi:hypothetical protein